jgi:Flp pilus assembly protein TadD
MKKLASALVLVGVLAGGCARGQKTETFDARKRLTREMIARGEWSTAFSYAESLHREDPEDAEALTLRGVIYRERNLPTEAEADLRAAIASDPKSEEAHAALAILLDHTSRPEEAERHHERAVALAPKNAAYLNNRAFSLFLRRRYKEAVEIYGQAVRLDPTNQRLRTNHGFALAATGDFPRAAREFQMGGAPAVATNNLGFAYEQKGDLARAYDLYLEALRLDPKSERARSNLVHVASRIGRSVPADLLGPAGEPDAHGAAREPRDQKGSRSP